LPASTVSEHEDDRSSHPDLDLYLDLRDTTTTESEHTDFEDNEKEGTPDDTPLPSE